MEKKKKLGLDVLPLLVETEWLNNKVYIVWHFTDCVTDRVGG